MPSYFEQFVGIEKHVARLPWRKRMVLRWHLWKLARAETRMLNMARSVLRRGPEQK